MLPPKMALAGEAAGRTRRYSSTRLAAIAAAISEVEEDHVAS
jgi:hypothetical protein